MIHAFVMAAVVAQAPAMERSPLSVQAEALAEAPAPVQYEFIKQVIPDYGVTLAQYRYFNHEKRKVAVQSAYYLQALDRALLLHRGDPDLTSIINTFKTGEDAERISLEFEATYRKKYKVWPPLIPVDVDALIDRMLQQRMIR